MNNENKMGTMPIPKLLLNMGVPMILSMVLQAVYNIVDSFFVSNMPDTATLTGVGEAAVNALTLAFPVQMLIVALGIGTGVGTNVLLSLNLGQGKPKRAGRAAGNAFVLAGIIYLIFLLFGLFGTHAYISSQTQNPVVQQMAEQYLSICCICSFGIVFFSIFEKILQASGKTHYSTTAQIAGAVINMILDPIMIYGLLGCPAFGIRGAAYATIIGQIASLLVAAWFHFKKNKEIPFSLSSLRLDWQIVRGIYSIGIPAIIAQAVMSVMTYGINLIFGTISESYVTAYGIFYKVQQFVLFAAFGMRDAITPVISYNYGKKDTARIKEGIRYGMIDTCVIMLVCFVILELFAAPFAGIFSLSKETEQLCITAMHVVSISFLFAGANIAFQGVFQALGCGIESLIISLLRQLVFVLPLTWIFSKVAVGSVWISFVIAEVISCAVACLLMKYIWRKKINV